MNIFFKSFRICFPEDIAIDEAVKSGADLGPAGSHEIATSAINEACVRHILYKHCVLHDFFFLSFSTRPTTIWNRNTLTDLRNFHIDHERIMMAGAFPGRVLIRINSGQERIQSEWQARRQARIRRLHLNRNSGVLCIYFTWKGNQGNGVSQVPIPLPPLPFPLFPPSSFHSRSLAVEHLSCA